MLDGSGLANLDWASVSATEPSYVKVWLDDVLTESVFVGAYSPHTWWLSNPLLGCCALGSEQIITIEVGNGAIFRVEGSLCRIET